jgi:glucose dehydrogenase
MVASGQDVTTDVDWPTYGGDLASTRYSPLAQIDASNFNELEIAWQFKTDNLGPRPESGFQSTPLVVDGMLYSTGGSRRAVFALDAATGELLWMHRIDEGARGEAAPRKLSGRGLPPLDSDGLPIVKPPWGRITAIDLNRGEIVWQLAHGETPDHIRDHPALEGVELARTGQVGRIGTLVTRTLVISGDATTFTTPSGKEGAMLRAYDKATGNELGEVYMPAPETGSPMSYAVDGAQYVVLAIGGNATGGLIAFKLPSPTTTTQSH